MRKKISITLCCVMIISALAFAGCSTGNWDYNEAYFGASTYKETKHTCSDEDREAIQPVLDEIEKAFSTLDTSDNNERNFGALERYCIDTDYYEDVVSETHNIEFVTAKTENDKGYIWIKYSQEGIDNNGEVSMGSIDILSRIEIKKIDNKWVAISVDEAP